MEVNGFLLPSAFVLEMKRKTLYRRSGCWELKKERDSYGRRLETELGELFYTRKRIVAETAKLPTHFALDGVYGEPSEWSGEPGFIEDITDFSPIVNFATSGDGAPFCFDFRSSEIDPDVIWWDDVYWRRISSSYTRFIELFHLVGD